IFFWVSSSTAPGAREARASAWADAFARRYFTLSFVGKPDSIERARARRNAVDRRGLIVCLLAYPAKTARFSAWWPARERSARTFVSSTDRTSRGYTIPPSYAPRRSRPTVSG